MESNKQRIEELRSLFPDDERFRNALLMAMGCTDQLPVLNEAFRGQLLDLPKRGEATVPWENLTYLALADVLLWSAKIELALHDLRASLFYRYNNRVQRMEIPTKEELELTAQKIADTPRSAKRESEEKPEAKQPTAKKIGAMFGVR